MEEQSEPKGEMPEAPQGETPAPADDPGVTPEPEAESAAGKNVEELEAKLREARNDAIKYRTRLREFEQADEERRRASLSEAEQKDLRLRELEAEIARRDDDSKRLALESAVAMKASTIGIVDPEAAIALLDPDLLDYGENGRPTDTSLDAALRHLVKSKPYLRTQPAAASPANPAKAEPKGETAEQKRARLFGGSSGLFDPASASSHGGGVITNRE